MTPEQQLIIQHPETIIECKMVEIIRDLEAENDVLRKTLAEAEEWANGIARDERVCGWIHGEDYSLYCLLADCPVDFNIAVSEHDETNNLQMENAALKARLKPVEDVYGNLEGLKLNHYTCEDAWYSCPKSGECCHDLNGNDCLCGADTHNKKVDKIINFIKVKVKI